MAQLPDNFFIILGTLVLSNVGVVISIFVGIGKLIWFISKLEARVSHIEKEHTKDLNEAFMKIRHLETKGGL